MEQKKVTARNVVSEEQKNVSLDEIIEEICKILDEIED